MYLKNTTTMSMTTYFTGWITKKVITTIAWIAIPLFLVVQCNRGCGSDLQLANSTFDYITIATSLPKKDTTPIVMELAVKDLQKITVEEMINFSKHYDELFISYIRKKYKIENGYVTKIE